MKTVYYCVVINRQCVFFHESAEVCKRMAGAYAGLTWMDTVKIWRVET